MFDNKLLRITSVQTNVKIRHCNIWHINEGKYCVVFLVFEFLYVSVWMNWRCTGNMMVNNVVIWSLENKCCHDVTQYFSMLSLWYLYLNNNYWRLPVYSRGAARNFGLTAAAWSCPLSRWNPSQISLHCMLIFSKLTAQTVSCKD